MLRGRKELIDKIFCFGFSLCTLTSTSPTLKLPRHFTASAFPFNRNNLTAAFVWPLALSSFCVLLNSLLIHVSLPTIAHLLPQAKCSLTYLSCLLYIRTAVTSERRCGSEGRHMSPARRGLN